MSNTYQISPSSCKGMTVACVVGFVFAFRVCLTFLFFQSAPITGAAVTVALSVLLLLAALGSWAASSPPREGRERHSRTIAWIWLYLLLAAVSLSWTTTHSIVNAAAYWLGLAADVMTVVLMVWHGPAYEKATGIMKGYVVGAVALAIVAWCTPTMEDLRLGHEDFLHPNAIGYAFALAALFAVFLSRQSRVWVWTGMGLGITLLRTLSKASIIAFLAAMVLYMLSDSKMRRRSKVRIGVAVAVVLALSWSLLENYVDLYTQGTQAETLTGRTIIWAQAYDTAWEKPWLGHGFYSFRWVVPLFGDFEAWQAHNELLQQFFAYGVAGVAVVIILYLNLYRDLRSARGAPQQVLGSALLLFAVVRGLVDTERFDLTYPLWLMAMMSIWLSHTPTPASRQYE